MKTEDREKMLADLLSKKRNYNIDTSDDYSEVLAQTENELNKMIADNQKELEKLSKNFSDADLKDLQNNIEKDFGIKTEIPEKVVLGKDNKEVFEEIEKNLNIDVIGQKNAVRDMIIALRRPYVIGSDIAKTRNSIIISGTNGTGRHLLVEKAAAELKKKGLIVSSETYRLDMSRYQTTSQEILFLQDIYVALNGKNTFVIIENFEQASPVFNRMLTELVIEGKCLLNKRYVFAGNQLQEATSKLSNDIIDYLPGNNKILVFITEKKPSKLMDYFGTTFLDKIVDKVETQKYDEDSLKIIIKQLLDQLKEKCKTQLDFVINIETGIEDYLFKNYEPNDGVDSLTPVIKNIYNALVDIALKNEIKDDVTLIYKNNVIARVNNKDIELDVIMNNDEERQEIQKELDEIVGLKEVKDYLLSLEDHLKINQIRKQKGLKTAEISKHMIFTGNPGTGKTTIARIVSRMMKACGILKQGQLVEVTRADLVGKYVGHTAPLTMSVIQSALGGVLFIDEAYSLYRGKDDSFGLEAIDSLVKAMEDHRDDLIVILAGYSKEMEVFLQANSGLKSRFANIIHFEDYTGEELMLIAKSIAKSKDYRIDDAALKPLQDYFTLVQAKADNTGGNGRLARNVVEDAILKQSKRLLNDSNAELDLLIKDDFVL